jgi:hypothetical protein
MKHHNKLGMYWSSALNCSHIHAVNLVTKENTKRNQGKV